MRRGGSRFTVGLVAALVVVILAGAGSAIAISTQLRRTAAAADPGSVRSPAPSSRRTSGRTGNPTTEPAGSSSAGNSGSQAAASPRAGSTVGPSTNLTVQLSPAARRHPQANRVQAVLQRYFDAVNQHDFQAWSDAVSPALSRSQTGDRWQQAYASTVDSSIVVTSVTTDPLVATVEFTSEQDASLAPVDLPVDCIHWKLTYRLTMSADSTDETGGLVDGTSDAVKVAC